MSIKIALINIVISLGLVGLFASIAHANPVEPERKPVKRIVIKHPVKQNLLTNSSVEFNQKYLVRTYNTPQVPAKIIQTKQNRTRTPNLFNSSVRNSTKDCSNRKCSLNHKWNFGD